MNQFKNLINYFYLDSKEKLPHDKTTHITYICIFGVILTLTFLITFHQNNKNNLTFFNLKLPPLCLSKSLTNTECPGCGMTRSFVNIAKFNFGEAFKLNRVSIPLFIYFIYAFLYHSYCLTILNQEVPSKLSIYNKWFANLILILLISNWFLGLFIGSNGGLT